MATATDGTVFPDDAPSTVVTAAGLNPNASDLTITVTWGNVTYVRTVVWTSATQFQDSGYVKS